LAEEGTKLEDMGARALQVTSTSRDWEAKCGQAEEELGEATRALKQAQNSSQEWEDRYTTVSGQSEGTDAQLVEVRAALAKTSAEVEATERARERETAQLVAQVTAAHEHTKHVEQTREEAIQMATDAAQAEVDKARKELEAARKDAEATATATAETHKAADRERADRERELRAMRDEVEDGHRMREEQARAIGEHEARHAADAETLARLTEEVRECERIMATLQEESARDQSNLAQAHSAQGELQRELEQARREGRDLEQGWEQTRGQLEQGQDEVRSVREELRREVDARAQVQKSLDEERREAAAVAGANNALRAAIKAQEGSMEGELSNMAHAKMEREAAVQREVLLSQAVGRLDSYGLGVWWQASTHMAQAHSLTQQVDLLRAELEVAQSSSALARSAWTAPHPLASMLLMLHHDGQTAQREAVAAERTALRGGSMHRAQEVQAQAQAQREREETCSAEPQPFEPLLNVRGRQVLQGQTTSQQVQLCKVQEEVDRLQINAKHGENERQELYRLLQDAQDDKVGVIVHVALRSVLLIWMDFTGGAGA
jgi:hypothetical protein